MKIYDLSKLEWILTGMTPYVWQIQGVTNVVDHHIGEVQTIPAKVPGSVQNALYQANLLPDWNIGLNIRQCEWVENRHWIFQTILPDDWVQSQTEIMLNCQGLDDRGWVFLNGEEVGCFNGTHRPHRFRLSPYIHPFDNLLQIVFDMPPRWLGQIGYTSQMTEWKSRFYYTWDWVPRLVQIGVWDTITLEIHEGADIGSMACRARVDPNSWASSLSITGQVSGGASFQVHTRLYRDDQIICQATVPVEKFNHQGVYWQDLAVDLWYPNGLGPQPLYDVSLSITDHNGKVYDEQYRRIGFKHVEWIPCKDAVPEADPWICVVNGVQVFLQGFNWTPIRPNFADVQIEDYRSLLLTYQEMGCNVLRVWGGAYLEKEIFYNLCDEFGILVWQDFPLSSSGVDNWPPEDEASIAALTEIAKSYIDRKQHHVSLLMWCGGNELQGSLDGGKTGGGKPVDLSHPLIQRFANLVAECDPDHRFVPTSSSGPRFFAKEEDFGKGLHWDVHGPWKADPDLKKWQHYWEKMDALFNSEVGAPGASSADIVCHFAGNLSAMPANGQNPLWKRFSWWIEWDIFIQEKGREPETLDEYVAWSQARQAEALRIVASSLKEKFPRCGGVLFWMGHDCFPTTSNTSVIDFWGRPKPAALALADVFCKESKQNSSPASRESQ